MIRSNEVSIMEVNKMEVNKVDQSDYGVQVRREWIAEQYLAGNPTHYIWLDYQKRYDLSRRSFENDITLVRNNISIDVRENYEEILNTELQFLYDLRAKALKEGDRAMALRVQKQITDLIKLVTPKQSSGVNIQVNNHTNNMNLPDLSVDQIRELLKGNKGEESKSIQI